MWLSVQAIRARARAWRRRVRVLAQPSAALLLALSFALAEPLACIIHCELYLAWAQDYQQAKQPHEHHHHQQLSQATPATSLAPESLEAQPTALPSDANCFQARSGSSQLSTLPSPVHEVVLAILVALSGIVPLIGRAAYLTPVLVSRGAAPPTPPPRASFA